MNNESIRPYTHLSSYYRHHWQEYSLDYLKLIDNWYTEAARASRQRGVGDLGCGTGFMSIELAGRGYPVFGIDVSAEMLAQARDAAEGLENPPVFIQGDIVHTRFPAPAAMAFMAYDVINYLLEKEDLQALFTHLGGQLPEGGILMFDMNTPEIYRVYHGVRETIEIPGGYITQDTRFNRRKGLGKTRFTIHHGGKRLSELHVQRVYEIHEISAWLERCGFQIREIFDDFDGSPAHAESQKPIFIAQNAGKGS
ncbi:class I SAM-dependent methyltransferase [Salinispira pacifica]|uniref:Methyltransferase n=1 Tax=Salinispira pacifica TaxID=1307761 RepID=V5WI69_9SPIO|nr:class I SAM-dependent methyltransferase [Salinispira pacifica]AHC15488.1 Methyltransferase [Salinispira pacifica]